VKTLLTITALAEAFTGFVLLIAPAFVGRLLFGAEMAEVAVPVARVFGIALVSLGCACWPGRTPAAGPLSGMLTYNVLATLYLAYVGVRGEWVGPFLWPVIALHAVFAILLLRAWCGRRKTQLV